MVATMAAVHVSGHGVGKTNLDVSYEYPPDPDMIHAFTQHIMTNAVDQ